MKAGRNSIIVNILLSIFKLCAGIFGNSTAMMFHVSPALEIYLNQLNSETAQIFEL